MKYDINEIEKALKYVRDHQGPTAIEVEFDPKERLLIKFTNTVDEGPCIITIYPERNESGTKFAEVTSTKRL